MKRIGILTSGGDCPGLNAVIRGAVKSCHHLGYDCVGFLKGYEGLYDPVQYVHLTPKNTAGILNRGGTILGSTNKGRFAATVGVQDRKELDPDLVEGVKETISQLGIDGLICVGGDGSLAVAQQFHEKGIPVVGVPKTIDNDLSATAFTFGFDSAIECATDALDRLHTTAESHERIMVLEVMGRHAGWIALHSGIAGGGDVILLPEVKWNFDHVCHKIMHRESQGKKFTLVVVAEGAELPDSGLVGEQVAGQQMKLGGVGRAVAEQIESRLHREARLCVLGHLQRGGSPTTFDRVLATQFGAHAVRLIKEERFGEMICSRPPEMMSVPIMEAVNVLRQVDPNGPAVQAARALGISFGDRPADGCGLTAFDTITDEDVFVTEENSLEVMTTEEVASEEFADVDSPEEPTVIEEPAEEISPDEVLESEVDVEGVTVEEVTEEQVTVEEPVAKLAEVEEPVTEEPVAEEVLVNEVEETAVEEASLEEAPSEVASVEETADENPVAPEEEVAEEVLDLVADVDEAANGTVELVDVEESVAEEATNTESEIESPQEETAVESEAVAEEATNEAPDLEEPVAEAEPTAELAEAPIVEEAKAEESDTNATETETTVAETKPSTKTLELDLSDLVKKRLAAATAELDRETASKSEEADETSEAKPTEDSALELTSEPTADSKPETKPEPLAATAESPFEEDLLAEARSALEKALSE